MHRLADGRVVEVVIDDECAQSSGPSPMCTGTGAIGKKPGRKAFAQPLYSHASNHELGERLCQFSVNMVDIQAGLFSLHATENQTTMSHRARRLAQGLHEKQCRPGGK